MPRNSSLSGHEAVGLVDEQTWACALSTVRKIAAGRHVGGLQRPRDRVRQAHREELSCRTP